MFAVFASHTSVSDRFNGAPVQSAVALPTIVSGEPVFIGDDVPQLYRWMDPSRA